LKIHWTDQFVAVSPDRLELRRFQGIVGRVITINHNNKAIVDFQDGGWYDINPDCLRKLDAASAKTKYNAKANSAQPIPDKQG
jgi:alkyl sulfatase BDS1-like metallo-beta-lactamase superfamily hydrolase